MCELAGGGCEPRSFRGRVAAAVLAAVFAMIVELAAAHVDARYGVVDAAGQLEVLAVSDDAADAPEGDEAETDASEAAEGDEAASEDSEGSEGSEEADASAKAVGVSYPLTDEGAAAVLAAIDALAVPDGDSGAFAAIDADGAAAVASADEYRDVADALAAFAERGYEAGFVLYDFSTGRALAYGLDRSYYCASTVKGPFSAYVAQSVVDGGGASLDDLLEEVEIVGGSGIMDADGVSTYTLAAVVENAILYSDNTAYRLLWRTYGGDGFASWAQACGVDASAWGGAEYPSFSARDLAKLWVGIGRYLGSGAASSAWLGAAFAQSGTSFLRGALGEGAVVLSKPGFDSNLWHESGIDMGALHDAGIVEDEAGAYLVAIMSNADYDSSVQTENEPLFSGLARALAGVRASWTAAE